MEAAAHREGQGLAARLLHRGLEGLQLLPRAGHHQLPRAVVVDRVHPAEPGAQALHRGVVQLDHRHHGRVGLLGGGLHGLPPGADDGKAVLRADRAGKGQGRYLPQGEARQGRGGHPRLPESARRRQIHAVQAGLGVAGDGQLLLCALEALGEGAGPQPLRQVEHRPGGGAYLVQGFSHAGILGPLAREHQGYFTHFFAPFSTVSASSKISRIISAAGCSLFTMAAICPARKEPVFSSPSTAAR